MGRRNKDLIRRELEADAEPMPERKERQQQQKQSTGSWGVDERGELVWRDT